MTATHDAEGATPDRNPDESDLIKVETDHEIAHRLLAQAREVKRLGAEADAAFLAARAADARTDAARAEYLEARNTLRKMESEVAL